MRLTCAALRRGVQGSGSPAVPPPEAVACGGVVDAVVVVGAGRLVGCGDAPWGEADVAVDGDVERVLETASLVLVGADTVYEDGSFKNKIGTRPIAEAAQRRGVRTVVACELLKLVPVPPPAVEDEPELRDTTAHELVDEIVTEEGSVVPEEVRSLIERTPFLREGYRLLKT